MPAIGFFFIMKTSQQESHHAQKLSFMWSLNCNVSFSVAVVHLKLYAVCHPSRPSHDSHQPTTEVGISDESRDDHPTQKSLLDDTSMTHS
jgi:hypothetical protein